MGPGGSETPPGVNLPHFGACPPPAPPRGAPSCGLEHWEVVTPLEDSGHPSGMDAPGRSRGVPKATRSPGKRWLPAHVLLQLPKSPGPCGSPAPPSRGEAAADPADIPALPACRPGRICEATAGSSLSARSPLPPDQGQARRGLPLQPPRSPHSLRGHPITPHPKLRDGSRPPPLSQRVICILSVKEI